MDHLLRFKKAQVVTWAVFLQYFWVWKRIYVYILKNSDEARFENFRITNPASSEFELLLFNIQNIQSVLALRTEINNTDMAESSLGITLIFMKLHRKLTEFVRILFMVIFVFHSASTFKLIHLLWSSMC